jgi:hypothetical protein
VLRFWNNDIDGNLEGVLTVIDDALRSPHPASLRSATLPLRGRDKQEDHPAAFGGHPRIKSGAGSLPFGGGISPKASQ